MSLWDIIKASAKGSYKYKGYIICGNSIWFDAPYWYCCNPYQIFARKGQAEAWIDKQLEVVA